jgi:CheY-like chemotaxis protein
VSKNDPLSILDFKRGFRNKSTTRRQYWLYGSERLITTFINRKAKKENNLPCFILIDIKMPRMNGKDFILEIAKDDVLRHIPRKVFSTLISPIDNQFFLSHDVQAVIKPTEFKALVDEVEEILPHCA